jgi:ATP-binding cassette subfamily C (CFTR/MRP) protein 1
LQLARAVYRDSDIYLLDDPLSALDAKVGNHVFKNVLIDELNPKTVLLVTNQLHMLEQCDELFVLDQGKIVERGSFKQLLNSNGLFADLMSNYVAHDETSETQSTNELIELGTKDEKEKEKESTVNIIQEEERKTGRVKSTIYKEYLRALGYISLVFILISWVGSMVTKVWSQLFLAQASAGLHSINVFLTIYPTLGSLQAFTEGAFFLAVIFGGIRAGNVMHNAAVVSLFSAPMSFFDSQPVGRILNRMTSDVTSLDIGMLNVVINILGSIASVVTGTILIGQANWYIIIALSIFIIVSVMVFRFYQASNLELKRLQSLAKSPLDALVSETLNATDIINAFQDFNYFYSQQQLLVDDYQASSFIKDSVEIWVRLRLRLLSSFIGFSLILIGYFMKQGNGINVGEASAIALALVNCLGLSNSIYQLLFWLGQGEAELNAVERLSEYAHQLAPEAPQDLKTDPSPNEWPLLGAISLSNVEIRYPSRPDFPVIKDLSIDIKPGEKIGVVGRTGAGKSSLMTALFRINELSNGSIKIDDLGTLSLIIDISKIGLKTLRTRMQMIPQEPVLFQGTFRTNLDPLQQYSDQQVWDTLKMIGLDEHVSSLTLKLESLVESQGENLSAGQRQLMCLGYSILAKPKILVMDEATSQIDGESDQLIQTLIRTHFKDTTVISIAHRLNTIAAFDRVIVLHEGEVVEFDSPRHLLSNPDSLFSQLTEASGPSNAQAIRDFFFQ